MIGAGLPSAWCFSTQMKGFQDVFLKSVTNHSIHFHFEYESLVVDILWHAWKILVLPDVKQYFITNTNMLSATFSYF